LGLTQGEELKSAGESSAVANRGPKREKALSQRETKLNGDHFVDIQLADDRGRQSLLADVGCPPPEPAFVATKADHGESHVAMESGVTTQLVPF